MRMIAIATALSAALTPIENRVKNIPSSWLGKSRRLKLYADQHGNQVAACYKTEDADKEKYRTEYEETFYWYHNLFVLLLIT